MVSLLTYLVKQIPRKRMEVESLFYSFLHYAAISVGGRGCCPGFSWERLNFHKKLAGLTQTSQSDGIFYTM